MMNTYPEQRERFIEVLLRYSNDMPPQSGLTTEHSEQNIEYALHQIGDMHPKHDMVRDLTAQVMAMTEADNFVVADIRYGLVYDHLCEKYGRQGYYPVPHSTDPFYTVSHHVKRVIMEFAHEHIPTATDTQVAAMADAIYRRLEQDHARPLNFKNDAWRRNPPKKMTKEEADRLVERLKKGGGS